MLSQTERAKPRVPSPTPQVQIRTLMNAIRQHTWARELKKYAKRLPAQNRLPASALDALDQALEYVLRAH